MRRFKGRVLRGVGDLTEGIGEWQGDCVPEAAYYNNFGNFVNSHYRTSNRGGGGDDSFVGGYGTIIVDYKPSRVNSKYVVGAKEVCVKNLGVEFFSQTH